MGGPIIGWGDPRRGCCCPGPGPPGPPPGLGTIPGDPTAGGGVWGETAFMGLCIPCCCPGLKGLLSWSAWC